ncbi:MAG: sensor histidine kinase [Limisphaerales bacterium]
MSAAEFLRWAARFPEPLLMVSASDGKLLCFNDSAGELLGLAGEETGSSPRTIYEFADGDPEKVKHSLLLWARSGHMTYGYARLRTLGSGVCRCEGAILTPKSETQRSVVMVRLKPADMMVGKFLALNERIDELGRQVQARLKAEALLQQERDHLEEAVTNRTAELRELVEHLESFSYSITHDLRAPLRAINSFAQLLVADCGERLDPTGREYLQRIIGAAERLDRLILDVLQYSRLRRDELPLTRVSMEQILRDILEEYPDFAERKRQIRFLKQCENTDVLANVAALTQVISNLIGNALKFVAPGQEPNVQITCERLNGKIRLSVRDSGIGIERRHLERIFGLFEKLNEGDSGTGIGLAIVKQAAMKMGGEIGVESQAGVGSVFWVELRAYETEA